MVGIPDPNRVRALVDPICALYDEVFSSPPFIWPVDESTHHRTLMHRLIDNPTFAIAVAESRGSLVGFAYGYGLAPGTGWWDGFQQPVAAEFREEWADRTFAVIDLAVQQNWRRQGLGRTLLESLLAGRAEERATLAVQPQSLDSHRFYAAIGDWTLIGRQDTPGFVSPEFDIYVRELNR